MSKPSLILLHGALGASSQLWPLKEVLSTQFEVETLTFWGHGNVPLPVGVSFGIEAFTDQLEKFLEEKKQPVRVFGYSMGGYVALRLAKKRPTLFQFVLTLGSKLDWQQDTAEKEASYLNLEFLKNRQPAFLARLEALHPANWPEILSNTAQMMFHLGHQNLLTAEDMKEVQVPAILAVGDRDKMVSIEETKHWASHAPGASLLVLPNTSHPIEKIERIAVEIIMLLLLSAKEPES